MLHSTLFTLLVRQLALEFTHYLRHCKAPTVQILVFIDENATAII